MVYRKTFIKQYKLWKYNLKICKPINEKNVTLNYKMTIKKIVILLKILHQKFFTNKLNLISLHLLKDKKKKKILRNYLGYHTLVQFAEEEVEPDKYSKHKGRESIPLSFYWIDLYYHQIFGWKSQLHQHLYWKQNY